MDQLYLDNIDEYVHDHDKIVTYKWLSLTLGVHVNTAKQMLFHYLEHKRKEGSASLHATFLLSGKSEAHGRTCHKVSVVREEDLEEAKSRLSAVVSVHVYSVHKALLRDSAPLFGVDYDAIKSNLHQCNKFSAIRCPDAVPLSKVELQQSRESRPPPPAQTLDQTKPQTGSKTSTKTAPKPAGIMGMFGKSKTETKPQTKSETKPEIRPEPRPEPKTETKTESTEQLVTESKPASKSNSRANFFGNQTTKKPVQTVKQEMSHTEQRPLQADRDQRSKSKRVESDEEPQEKKKRRRIRQLQSDSSDEEVIPDSPLQNKSPSPDPRVQDQDPDPDTPEKPVQVQDPVTKETPAPDRDLLTTKTRKRRRVLKSKTFIDDEGCIVTEKVYESESYSEDDEPQTKPGPRPVLNLGPRPGPKPGSAKAQTSDEKKKRGSAKSTKQASITGFFNKK